METNGQSYFIPTCVCLWECVHVVLWFLYVSLILTCSFYCPLHRSVFLLLFPLVLFLSFPFFSSKDNSPNTRGSIHTSRTQKPSDVHKRSHAGVHSHIHIKNPQFLVFWFCEAFRSVEGREYFLLKALIYNCCTALPCWDIGPLLALFS